jgi:hypothetical protein
MTLIYKPCFISQSNHPARQTECGVPSSKSGLNIAILPIILAFHR